MKVEFLDDKGERQETRIQPGESLTGFKILSLSFESGGEVRACLHGPFYSWFLNAARRQFIKKD